MNFLTLANAVGVARTVDSGLALQHARQNKVYSKDVLSVDNAYIGSLALVALAEVVSLTSSVLGKSLPPALNWSILAARATLVGVSLYLNKEDVLPRVKEILRNKVAVQVAVLAQASLSFVKLSALPFAQLSNALVGAEMAFRFGKSLFKPEPAPAPTPRPAPVKTKLFDDSDEI